MEYIKVTKSARKRVLLQTRWPRMASLWRYYLIIRECWKTQELRASQAQRPASVQTPKYEHMANSRNGKNANVAKTQWMGNRMVGYRVIM